MRRRKMSWLIMSLTKLNNCDEDSNNNAVGLIRAGVRTLLPGVCVCLAVRGHHKQDDGGFTTNACTPVSQTDTCTRTHGCHFSPVTLQDVFVKLMQDISHLQTPSRWWFWSEDTITAHRSCLEHIPLPMYGIFWWTDTALLVNLRRYHTTFWISIGSTV